MSHQDIRRLKSMHTRMHRMPLTAAGQFRWQPACFPATSRLEIASEDAVGSVSAAVASNCAAKTPTKIDFSCRLFPKMQTKMNDCWYASTQMIRSATCRKKTKPLQRLDSVTMQTRSGLATFPHVIGNGLDWETPEGWCTQTNTHTHTTPACSLCDCRAGRQVMDENDLEIDHLCGFVTAEDVHRKLDQRGMFIVGVGNSAA